MKLKFKHIPDGDYEARAGGVKFQIHNASVDRTFGLTAHRISDGRALHGGAAIQWLGTKRRCVAAAQNILDRELAANARVPSAV
jgi:hypothetical protein